MEGNIRPGTDAGFTMKDTNVTKGIAIVMMMVHHCFMSKERFAGFAVSFAPFTRKAAMGFAVYCKMCVPLFVLVSAYGMSLSLSRIKDHYPSRAAGISVRRLVRLYAGYWFAFIVCFVLCCFFTQKRLRTYHKAGNVLVNVLVDFMGFGFLHGNRTLLGTFWYVSFAVMQILLLPFIYGLMRKIHPVLVFALMILLSRLFGIQQLSNGNYNFLLLTAAGAWAAKEDLWGRIRRFGEDGKTGLSENEGGFAAGTYRKGKIVLSLLLLFASYPLFYSGFHTVDQDVTMAVGGFLVAASVFLIWARIPGLANVLEFLGIYSMNIFYFHNFFRINWLHDFLFNLKYWWLIAGTLLLVSLAVSITVEWVKKKTGYTKFMNGLAEKAGRFGREGAKE